MPIIEKFPDLLAPVGETILWEATIKANPKPKVIWQCDGRDVTLDSRFSTEDDYKNKKYYLKIKGVEVCDAGRYRIIVVNDMGEATAEATLRPFSAYNLTNDPFLECQCQNDAFFPLAEAPVFTKELPTFESIRDQNNYEVEVRVTGYPRPTVSWLRNGVEIFDDMRNTITSTNEGPELCSRWSIERFGEQDAGNYTCQAVNMAGSVLSCSELSLTRFPPKFFTSLPPALDLEEGEPLELFAKCDGSPIPSVAWYKDGEPIKPNGRVKLETLPDGTMRLSIDHVKPTDSGAYKVVASNNVADVPVQCAVAVRRESLTANDKFLINSN